MSQQGTEKCTGVRSLEDGVPVMRMEWVKFGDRVANCVLKK
jgi:hypothetical protein